MKRLTMLLAIFCLLIWANSALAFSLTAAGKYEDQIEQAMTAHGNSLTAEAIAIIEQTYQDLRNDVAENGNDNELLFLLAKTEFLTASLGGDADVKQAHQKMQIVCRKDAAYKEKVFDFLLEQGERYQVAKNAEMSLSMIIIAYRDFQTDEARVRSAAAQVYDVGMAALNQGDVSTARLNFIAAQEICPDIASAIKDNIIKASARPEDANERLRRLAVLYRVFPNDDLSVVNKIAEAYVSQKKPEKAELISATLPAFQEYPSSVQTVIITILYPPDYIIYGPGQKKEFILKAGEYSDHYIRADKGVYTSFLLGYGDFKMVTRSGKKYSIEEIPKYNQEDFRIYAVIDTDMGLVFE